MIYSSFTAACLGFDSRQARHLFQDGDITGGGPVIQVHLATQLRIVAQK